MCFTNHALYSFYFAPPFPQSLGGSRIKNYQKLSNPILLSLFGNF
ncbi:hypothetical protein LEP1GSC036_2417 [Leptospira weilii str. 2006001853]|uniref:Uncharacterized protein n=1 Tax=Leptospira weilii str. 2006001853 TaxID=1001589 RepID=A0A828YW60_9LEPT|nr:hypothetical protein LEP1GSC036_2417 [Leptospira weilii str. 2006001853]